MISCYLIRLIANRGLKLTKKAYVGDKRGTILKEMYVVLYTVQCMYVAREKVFTLRTVCKCRPYFSDQKCVDCYVSHMN
jgi:hypothetical protein